MNDALGNEIKAGDVVVVSPVGSLRVEVVESVGTFARLEGAGLASGARLAVVRKANARTIASDRQREAQRTVTEQVRARQALAEFIEADK